MCRHVLLCLLLPLTACAAKRCAPAPPVKIPGACADAESSQLTAVTWNAAIAPGMNARSSLRLPHAAAALHNLDYDLLCLQEVWPAEDAAKVIGVLNLPEENVFYTDTRGEGETGQDVCKRSHLNGLIRCVREHCAKTPPEDLTICARSACNSQLVSLYLFHRHCLNCLIASVGRSLPEIINTCVRSGTGASRIHGGASGVIFASRLFPLFDKETLRLLSSGANRVALLATIMGPGDEPIEVACAHLSSDEEVQPTNPIFSNWDEERLAQFRLIEKRLKERAGERPAIFLGDMNFGPGDGRKLVAVSESLWDESQRLGFVSPAAQAAPPLCSTCADNSFGYNEQNHLIDHILLLDRSGRLEPVCAEQVLEKPVVMRGYRGEWLRANLSDHYGIRVKFKLR